MKPQEPGGPKASWGSLPGLVPAGILHRERGRADHDHEQVIVPSVLQLVSGTWQDDDRVTRADLLWSTIQVHDPAALHNVVDLLNLVVVVNARFPVSLDHDFGHAQVLQC